MRGKILKAALLGVLAVSFVGTVWATNPCPVGSDAPCQNPTKIGTACTTVDGLPGTCKIPQGSSLCYCIANNPVPAVSEWGLGFLVLLLGTAGLLVLRERKGTVRQ